MKFCARKIFVIAFLFISIAATFSQIAMGKWRTHVAYNNVSQVAQSDNKIYAISEGSLFSVNKDDGDIEVYNKMTGLNDVWISNIAFDPANQQLFIVYSNGNMDIMSSDGISNMPDLYTKQMSSSKSVNSISFYENKAYLSCDFGVLVVNMKKKEIIDTYSVGINGLKVLSTIIFNNKIYALTSGNIYTADVNNQNLVNFESWSVLANTPGSGEFKNIFAYNNTLLLLRGNKMYAQVNNGVWNQIISDLSIKSAYISSQKLFIQTDNNQAYLVNTDYTKKLLSGINSISDAEYDASNNTSWLASASGVISYNESQTNPVTNTFKPGGPVVNSAWNMTFADEKLYVVSGGRWASFFDNPGYVMIYNSGTQNWINIMPQDVEKKTNIAFKDPMSVAVDPKNSKHFFVASASSGIYEFIDTTLVKLHNSTSSNGVIEKFIDLYDVTDASKFDKDGNLWITNELVNSTIKILKPNGQWFGLKYPEITILPNLQSILVPKNQSNTVWINSLRQPAGIFILQHNGTLENTSDDRTIFLSSFRDADNNGNRIAPGNVFCITEDLNGVIWAGTDQGPLLFYNTQNAFNSDYTCSRVKIPRNDGTNKADYLLVTERIRSIAVDGANRKWIGTATSGVYLMSEDGLKTIRHFTTSNSPLLSNDVLSIKIHPKTGEVFFGTPMGLVSYQSDAKEANDAFSDVHAYPNPVRESFNGIITITGLMENTNIKIIDIGGNLVCQTTSNGSIATWDGKNFSGKKVNTGIYLVIGVNSDGTQSTITKIMVIN